MIRLLEGDDALGQLLREIEKLLVQLGQILCHVDLLYAKLRVLLLSVSVELEFAHAAHN